MGRCCSSPSAGGRRRTGSGSRRVGLEPGKPVEVGKNLRSATHDWLYAIGDANGRALLTHMGKYQARIAADVILGKDASVVSDGPLSPRVIFTDPQVAAVGHTLASAAEAGLKVRALDVETGGECRRQLHRPQRAGHVAPRRRRGRRRSSAPRSRGVEVAESLHAATIAVVCELRLEQLVHAVPCFPTRSELWLKLLEADGL